MKLSVLASGSKGNVTYIGNKQTKLLIDIGMNITYIKDRLRELEILPEDIDYILLTHTHSDHTSALKRFIKNYKPTVCVSQKMFNELPVLHDYTKVLIYDEELKFDGIKINFFNTSHDAPDARGFIISDNKSSIVYVTDTGYINGKYFNKLKNKDVYIIESNHDPEILRNGKYPVWLQNRILSDYGHLSNEMASFYLAKLIGPKTKNVILAHLSADNNSEEAALETLKSTLVEHEIKFNNYMCARQKEKTKEIIL